MTREIKEVQVQVLKNLARCLKAAYHDESDEVIINT